MPLYQNIKKYRTAAGMSQEELARRTGYTDRSSIAKIEKGLVDLPESKIQLFAEAFGVTPAALMGPASAASEEAGREEKVEEIIRLFSRLSPERRDQALLAVYREYAAQQEDDRDGES